MKFGKGTGDLDDPQAGELHDPWVGRFGDDYTARQKPMLAARKAMFSRILASTRYPINGVIEFGAGVGENLQALRALLVGAHLTGVEINNQAFLELKKVADLAFHGSIIGFPSRSQWDMSLTRGLLVHIPPTVLPDAYDALYQASARYICIAEYHSPRFEDIPYRGGRDRLWKGPYAEQMLDRYADLRVVDYGFVWSRDPLHPQNDVTWFLLEKGSAQ